MDEVDKDTLAQLIVTVSVLPLLHPAIAEIDCNPVIISGNKPVVVDALIVIE
jgi:hypothetical protein